MSTLTYNYADSTVVLGPMSQRAEPHAYDLCERHARTLTAPVGWEILRITSPEDHPTQNSDDLLALARAVNTPTPEPTEPAGHTTGDVPRVDRSVRRPEPISPEGPARPSQSSSSTGHTTPAGDTPGRPVLRLLKKNPQ